MYQAIDNQPSDFTWQDSRGRDWDLSIKFKVADGREIAVGITIDSANGGRLTQEVLRELPFRRFTYRSPGTIKQRRKLVADTKKYQFRQGEGKYRGSRWLESEEIRLTKEVFLEAFRSGRPTIKAVAFRFGISQSAANKRIIKLRREGLLPPSRLGNKAKL